MNDNQRKKLKILVASDTDIERSIELLVSLAKTDPSKRVLFGYDGSVTWLMNPMEDRLNAEIQNRIDVIAQSIVDKDAEGSIDHSKIFVENHRDS